MVGRLLRAGHRPRPRQPLGWTALHEAVILGGGTDAALRTVRVLVAAGADITITAARDAMTAREHAEAKGYDDIAALLRAAE